MIPIEEKESFTATGDQVVMITRIHRTRNMASGRCSNELYQKELFISILWANRDLSNSRLSTYFFFFDGCGDTESSTLSVEMLLWVLL